MQRSVLVIGQLLRGGLALACVVGAYWFSPRHQAALWLLAPAVLLLRGCPVCWFSGLLRALDGQRPGWARVRPVARDAATDVAGAPGSPVAADRAAVG